MKQFTKGYAGNILRVNLSTGNVTTPLPEELVKNHVGGRGIAAKILYDELPPGTDPLFPSNKLIFIACPLAEMGRVQLEVQREEKQDTKTLKMEAKIKDMTGKGYAALDKYKVFVEILGVEHHCM